MNINLANKIAAAQAVVPETNTRVRTNANPNEEIAVVQVTKSANGNTYVYGVHGVYAPTMGATSVYPVKESDYLAVTIPSHENILCAVLAKATEVIARATKPRKTNLRVIMYDRAAIKHFAMMNAEKKGIDAVEGMCKGYETYSENAKTVFAAYAEAVRKFTKETQQRVIVETYRSQSYWDVVVDENVDTSTLTRGIMLQFRGNDCTSIPGIHFKETWHNRTATYKLHLDMQSVYDEAGNLVYDEEGKVVRKVTGYAVQRPVDSNGKPKNYRCNFILNGLAKAGKDNVPNRPVNLSVSEMDDLI